MRTAALFFLAVLAAAPLVAMPLITSVNPDQIVGGGGAQSIRVYGTGFETGLAGVFHGPAGAFLVQPSAFAGSYADFVVPMPIVNKQGHYTVVIRSAENPYNGRSDDSNAYPFVVAGQPADTTPPVLNLPGNISVLSGTVVHYNVSAHDAVDGAVTPQCQPASGSIFPVGTTQVNCIAFDKSGNKATGSFLVTVNQPPPPPPPPPITWHIPNDTTIGATAPDGAVFEYYVTASSGHVTCSPASPHLFPIGTTKVTCTAWQQDGNHSTRSFHVTVAGAAVRVFVPNNATLEATGPDGAIATFTASAEDNGPVTCLPASGSTFALGTTTITCKATNSDGTPDFNGRVGSASFRITVVDTTAPALSLPADIVTNNNAVTFTATASDIVDGAVAVTCTPASGSTFAAGTTPVACSAKDSHGNTANGSFNVTVNADTTPPQVRSISANPSTIWPPNNKMVAVTVTVDAIDDFDPAPEARIVSVTSSDDNDPTDWAITGPLTVDLRAERSSQNGRTYTITVEVVDDAGNVATVAVAVVVPKDGSQNTAPVTAPPTRRRSVGGS